MTGTAVSRLLAPCAIVFPYSPKGEHADHRNTRKDEPDRMSGEDRARLRRNAETAPDYLEKYSELLTGFGLSPAEFERHSIEIRISPIVVRAW